MSDVDSSLYTGTKGCKNAFVDLQASLGVQTPAAGFPSSSWAHDEHGRFNIWASNIGAFQDGSAHSSLDYRLRDSSRMREQTARVLQYLASSLIELTAITSGQRPQRTLASSLEQEDEFQLVQVIDALESFDVDDESVAGGGPQTEAETLSQAISSAITSLYKLSILLRNPTARDRYAKAARYPAFNATFDVDHVWQVYPKLRSRPALCDRLGKANTRRRQLLRYRQAHRERLSVPQSATAPSVSQQPVQSQQGPASSTADPAGLPEASTLGPTTATTFVSHDFQVVDQLDDVQSTLATTETGSGEAVRVPQPPAGALTGEPFECPYCFTIQTVSSMREWKKHLFSDLQPYVCTCEGDCSQTLYSDRPAWFEHELSTHRKLWDCRYCAQEVFPSADGLASHLRDNHQTTVSAEHLLSLVDISSQPIEAFDRSSCPFCDDWQLHAPTQSVPASMFRNHVAHHLEQLALFVLPNTTQFITTDGESDDDDDDDDSAGSADSTARRTVTGEVPNNDSPEAYPSDIALKIFKDDEVVPLETVRQLGVGAAGIIDEARQTKTGVLYARKLLKEEHRQFAQKGFDQEQEILSILGLSPHTMQLIGVYQWRAEMGMLRLPVANTNLASILATDTETVGLAGDEMDRKAFLVRSIGCLMSGVQWMHRQGISHSDLKPRNVLVGGTLPFWAGFGIASELEPAGTVPPGPAITPKYAAPEVASAERRGQPADVFSLACIFSEMIAAIIGLSESAFAQEWNKDGSGNLHSNVSEAIIPWLGRVNPKDIGANGVAIIETCRAGLSLQEHLRPTSTSMLQTLATAAGRATHTTLFCPQCFQTSQEEAAKASMGMAEIGPPGTSDPFLHAAVLRNDIPAVQRLISDGADVNELGTDGTVLQAACFEGHLEIVNVLLDAGADVNATGGRYGNALQAAVVSGHLEIARSLLNAGAYIEAFGGEFGTALSAAAASTHVEILNFLVANGADVNADSGVYGSPLVAAASRGVQQSCQILLDHGADVNAQSRDTTPLSAAAARGDTGIVEFLLDHGADVNCRHGGYASALQTASATGRIDVVKLLVERGADVRMTGGVYGDCLNAAKVVGHPDVVAFLQPFFDA